jgi:acid phosphatase
VHRHPRARRWTSFLALITIGLLVGVIVATPSAPTARVTAFHGAAGEPSSGVGNASSAAGRTVSSQSFPTRSTVGPAATTTTSSLRLAATAVATRHVWWIVMENHEYRAIIGNRRARYINALAARYALATRYFATRHPSEPNYIALVAGATLGVTSDGVYHLARRSIFSQLAHARRSWRLYAQDDRTGCFTGTTAGGGRDGPGAAGRYVRKHNPAISFTSVSGNRAQCRNIQPLRSFDPGAAPFEMIVPNLVNDMHDGTIRQGDAFLRAFVPTILANAAFRAGGVLFITFDEGSTRAGALGDRGGHVATLIISRGVARGHRFRAYTDHFSLLRTTEHILGLPCLVNACRRSPIVN